MQLAHLQAKQAGNAFESIVTTHAIHIGAELTQMPSGCRWVMNRAIPIKTPFDFILAYRGEVVLFDAKTTKQGGFVYSKITPHQLDSLFALECQGIRAGYLIWFRETDQISFVKASALKALKPRCSLKAEDGLIIGSRIDFDMRTIINAIRPKAKI